MANQGEKSNGVENEIDPLISVGTESNSEDAPAAVSSDATSKRRSPVYQQFKEEKKGFRCKHCKLVKRLVSLF